jgi:hypothetical protein
MEVLAMFGLPMSEIDSFVIVVLLYLIWARLGQICHMMKKEDDRRYAELAENELRKDPYYDM